MVRSLAFVILALALFVGACGQGQQAPKGEQGPPGPHIRTLDDGSCIVTLCLLDTRPRAFEDSDLEHLRDLAFIVMEQLQAFRPLPLERRSSN
jgi:hypothetical protein